MKSKVTVAIIVVIFSLSSCANEIGQKEGLGTIIGAMGGAVIGSNIGKGKGRTAAIALGTLAGAVLGADIGKTLDRKDRLAMKSAESKAHKAKIGEQITWNNPKSGNSGSVTPIREGKRKSSGAYCREYLTRVEINGRTQQAYGTACRQQDGSWKIVK